MELYILILIIALFLIVANASNNTALPGEVYWKSRLPNTPLPKTLQELLQRGNRSNFAEVELSVSSQGSKAAYNVVYWDLESNSMNKNATYNETVTYFLYSDLRPDKKMKLIFTKSANGSNFLPRRIAESIPFSTNKSQEILNYFSVTSKEAKIIKQTIEECEAPGIRGEEKYCATSFEALVDFVYAKLGENVRGLSNEVEKENKKQEYTILKGIKMIRGSQLVCHKQRYKYAVFYCHILKATKAYMVTMVGDDGSKAKAIAACHSDTSAWNPEHVAFHLLGVKPGGPPICHFLSSDSIIWVPM